MMITDGTLHAGRSTGRDGIGAGAVIGRSSANLCLPPKFRPRSFINDYFVAANDYHRIHVAMISSIVVSVGSAINRILEITLS